MRAKPHSGKRRRKKRRKTSRSSFFPRLARYWVEIVFAFLIASLAIAVILTVSEHGRKVERKKTVQSTRPPVASPPAKKEKKPKTAIPPAAVITPVKPPEPVSKPSRVKPAIAIIIDDLGADRRVAEKLLAIDAPITFAVLPHLRYSKSIALAAKKAGRVVMLHQPMQPQSAVYKPGPGVLLVSFSAEKIVKTLVGNILSVPGAIGVNNHMGSKFTENSEKIGVVLKELEKRKLFFIDSRTTAKTVAYDLAIAMGEPTAKRDVFLDNERTIASVSESLYTLADTAIMNGSAIAIGHPYKVTVEALKSTLPKLRAMGLRIVPVTRLLVKPE